METAPTLPDFSLALKPDDYQLPSPDASWNDRRSKQGLTQLYIIRMEGGAATEPMMDYIPIR